jgi:malonyl-CoA O-methyltransferase
MPQDLKYCQHHFDRVANRVPQHDAVLREIETRLLERIDMMRLEPKRIADFGCGAGNALALLSKRYPKAQLLGLDLSQEMLRQASGSGNAWRAMRRAMGGMIPGLAVGSDAVEWIQADFAQPPLAPASIDLLYSNAALHFSSDPAKVIAGWANLLREGGLLLFSCFGPDTLKELRTVWPHAAESFVRLTDMHDLGDMLMGAGLAAPVMEMESLTLTYPDVDTLLAELGVLSCHPAGPTQRGLSGRQARDQIRRAASAGTMRADGRHGVTVEVVTGHAWCVAKAQKQVREADGSTTIRVPLKATGLKPQIK